MKKSFVFAVLSPVLLFSGLLSVPMQFIAVPEAAAQHSMNVTVRTEDGKELPLYKDSHALVIGNEAYPAKNGWNPLPGAVNDVTEVAEVLEHHGFDVTLKTDVTTAEFHQAFSDFIYESGKDTDNRLLFYYAGHGYTTKSTIDEDLGYLVMLDTPPPENAAEFDLYSVDMVKLVSDSKKIHAKHVLFMFDSRFSGTILNLQNQDIPLPITEQIRNPVRQFITAGLADEPVPSRSVFKMAFLNLLERRVTEPLPDGYLTGVELADYLYRTVPALPEGQHPQHGKIRDPQLNTGDFVFVLPQNNWQAEKAVEVDTIATLDITTTLKGATVYIDRVFVGRTPLQGYPIDTGIHLEKSVYVGVEFPGYKSRVRKISLKGGQKLSWDVDLEKMERPKVSSKPELNQSPADLTENSQTNTSDPPDSSEDSDSSEKQPDVPQAILEEDTASTAETLSPSSNTPQTILGADTAPMVLIPAGEFQMGSSPGTFYTSATTPDHIVYVDAFYIDKYEVTLGQYNQFVLATNHRPLPDWVYQYASTDAHPVIGVSWEDARAYAKWAGKRLPTEAEWEKAARGGLVQKNHAWGDTPPDGTQCNFADKRLWEIWNREKDPDDNWADETLDDGYAYIAPVGSYPPNGYGLYDMEGNVWEWCFDAYDENFYADSPYENPIAEILIRDGASNIVAVNKLRVTRGSSWYDSVPWIASRFGQSPETRVRNVGFRCVQSVTP
ncbi:MAG: SUMF1/EgtB/PvdO family nonheme iron enzyme [Candidatus Poribacteria bacterium]|nr:SUMF1/EgtB/PvdO family nonheme iron enzyme [Candidatus Poribacteria bacterium]